MKLVITMIIIIKTISIIMELTLFAHLVEYVKTASVLQL